MSGDIYPKIVAILKNLQETSDLTSEPRDDDPVSVKVLNVALRQGIREAAPAVKTLKKLAAKLDGDGYRPTIEDVQRLVEGAATIQRVIDLRSAVRRERKHHKTRKLTPASKVAAQLRQRIR